MPAGLQEMIDEADRDGDGEVNEEEFFRCLLFCLAQRLGSKATCAQLFSVHCVECHVLVVSEVMCSLLHGPIAKGFPVIADTAGILAVGS